jgi:hypothetical protein
MAFTVPGTCFGQQTVPTTKTYIKLGEDFLHGLYPELNDKKYTITVETSFRYDDPTDIPRVFTLDVGTGPKSLVISCCFGGYAGGNMAFKIPDPIEWPPPSPPLCTPAPSCPLFATPRYPMRPKNVDREGKLRPEQFLTGYFSFDVEGRLMAFSAQGSATANHEADNQLYEALRNRLSPTLSPTDAEITKMLTESGAKYGFEDKQRFRDNLPVKELEKFIGTIEVRSLEFEPIAYGSGDDPVNNLRVWSFVVVLMSATQKDGTKLTYRAFFDHFTGALTSLHEWPGDPNRRY